MTLAAFGAEHQVKSVTLLATGEDIGWSQTSDGLRVGAPKAKLDTAAIAYKIALD